MPAQVIKDVVSPVIAVGHLIDSAADGVSLGDIMGVVGVLKKVKPAIDAIKSGKLVDEYKALDETGKAELAAWFNSEFDITNDSVEAAVEQAWVVVLGLSELVKLIKPTVPQVQP